MCPGKECMLCADLNLIAGKTTRYYAECLNSDKTLTFHTTENAIKYGLFHFFFFFPRASRGKTAVYNVGWSFGFTTHTQLKMKGFDTGMGSCKCMSVSYYPDALIKVVETCSEMFLFNTSSVGSALPSLRPWSLIYMFWGWISLALGHFHKCIWKTIFSSSR